MRSTTYIALVPSSGGLKRWPQPVPAAGVEKAVRRLRRDFPALRRSRVVLIPERNWNEFEGRSV